MMTMKRAMTLRANGVCSRQILVRISVHIQGAITPVDGGWQAR